VAPSDRWIPVYGKLHSTWPVAGGVLVENGVAYAAAGIANYDGTYVCALDAITGKLKWNNDSSGTITPAGEGTSLQSELFLRDKSVCFNGGTMFSNASYDLGTGEFNSKMARAHQWFQRYLFTPYYPYFPNYGQYREGVEEHMFPDGRKLSLKGPMIGDELPLLEMYPAPKPVEPAPKGTKPSPSGRPVPTWQILGRYFNQLILGPQAIVVAGTQVPLRVPGKPSPKPPFDQFLAAMKLDDGTDIWNEKLPGQVVRGGVSLDHTGRIFVALEDGQVFGFGPAN
jgi:outer membrane protein assembly factor BamB